MTTTEELAAAKAKVAAAEAKAAALEARARAEAEAAEAKAEADAKVAEVAATAAARAAALDALDAACGDWTRNERIELQFARFPHGRADLGQQITCSLADWVDYRAQFLNKSLPLHSSGSMKERKLLQPLEIGIISTQQAVGDRMFARRRNTDILAMTWIYIDCDSGADPMPLIQALAAREIAFVATESSTSRLEGNGLYKWHLFLPLLKPKQLPSGDHLARVETADRCADWWDRVHAHVEAYLLCIGGLPPTTKEKDTIDQSAKRMCQGAFVAHRPDASPARMLVPRKTSGARCLDLDAFLEATGFEDIEPPAIRLEDVEHPKPLEGVVADGSEGSTPGETTGTLLIKALEGFHMVGSYDSGKYEVLCPWRHEHTSAVAEGKQDQYSSSTVVMMSGGPKGDGGFSCLHDGCRDALGHVVSAADVISWARKNGNTLIPDRPEWSNSVADIPIAPTKPRELPPTPALSFALAPQTEMEPPRVVPQAQRQLPDRADRIDVTIDYDNLQGLIHSGIRALGKHPAYYQTPTSTVDILVELVERPNAQPYIRAAKSATFGPALQEVSRWVRPASKPGAEVVAQEPPDRTVTSILAAGRYPGVRPLAGIMITPPFHADGVIIQQPGYCSEIGVVYAPQSRIPLVSPDPSLASLVKAKADLMEVIKDFPFAEGREDLCRGVWLAAIITRLLRTTFRGNLPMWVVNSGASGSGKGKLVDAAAIISDSVAATTVSFAADEGENERILGMLLKGDAPIVHLDNIRATLASCVYEQFLTTATFSTREIGSSGTINKSKKTTVGGLADSLFFASGNNVKTGGDMSRRVLRIDIDDRSGDPGSRKVTHVDLLEWVRKNRTRLLAAALTLCAGFYAARRRGYSVELPAYASFEAWSVVREVVVWCGFPDPIHAKGKADTDDSVADLGFFVENFLAFNGGKKILQNGLLETLKRDAKKHAGFVNFLEESADVNLKDLKASQRLGTWLSSNKYHGRTYLAADGRKWQVIKDRAKAGNTLELKEV